MVITELSWRNFKSYGNTTQTIRFDPDRGELILLVGRNGGGKTTVGDALDYVCYGTARGKGGKRAVLGTLPNRLNGNLWTEVKFRSAGTQVEISREMNPSRVTLLEDGEPYKKAGKIQERVDGHIGFDYDTFKSFISMSINDFKNFMSLPVDDKRKLLDRLFNLEALNDLTKIVKAMKAQNEQEASKVAGEVSTLVGSVQRVLDAIQRIEEKAKEDGTKVMEGLRNKLLEAKPQYEKLQTLIGDLDGKVAGLRGKTDACSNAMSELRTQAGTIKTQLDAYRAGKCPTCHTVLSDDFHQAHMSELEESLKQLHAAYKEAETSQTRSREEMDALSAERRRSEQAFASLKANVANMKSEYDKLKSADGTGASTQDGSAITEMRSTIEGFEKSQSDAEARGRALGRRTALFNKAIAVFGENGVKKSIIAKIVRPINVLVQQNIDTLGMPFSVVLDENFDAKVCHMNGEIDPETLSTGETKKVNISIMMAYIELIRMKRHINVMFLDEVFASIDVEGIYSILQMLKKFVAKYNVNVFLVHHAELLESSFDRVIRTNKSVFSYLEEYVVEPEATPA